MVQLFKTLRFRKPWYFREVWYEGRLFNLDKAHPDESDLVQPFYTEEQAIEWLRGVLEWRPEEQVVYGRVTCFVDGEEVYQRPVTRQLVAFFKVTCGRRKYK